MNPHKSCPFVLMPAEILDHIGLFLDNLDTILLSKTCWYLHDSVKNIFRLNKNKRNKITCKKDLWIYLSKKRYISLLNKLKGKSCVHWCVTDTAALIGDFELLIWARKNGSNWSTVTCINAIKSGHLDILIWLIISGCPWNGRISNFVIQYNQIEILTWLMNMGCSIDDVQYAIVAAKNGHLYMLKLLFESFPTYFDFEKYLPIVNNTAAFHGHLNILKWTINRSDSQFLYYFKEMCYNAICNGHLEVLVWLEEKGWDYFNNIYNIAIYNDQLAIIIWARIEDSDWDKEYWKQCCPRENYAIYEWICNN